MKRTLIALALLACAQAHAQTVIFSARVGRGTLNLTDGAKHCKPPTRYAFHVDSITRTLTDGCWSVLDEYVRFDKMDQGMHRPYGSELYDMKLFDSPVPTTQKPTF